LERNASGSSAVPRPHQEPAMESRHDKTIEQVFAKLKALLRKADMRTLEEAWRKIGSLLDLFKPDECAAYLRHAGYAPKTV